MGLKAAYPLAEKTFAYNKTYSFYFGQLAAVIFNQAAGNNDPGLRVFINTAPDDPAGFLVGSGSDRAGINKIHLGFPGSTASLFKAVFEKTLSYALGIILVDLTA
jgi:hypothetical protein